MLWAEIFLAACLFYDSGTNIYDIFFLAYPCYYVFFAPIFQGSGYMLLGMSSVKWIHLG